ncbi:MAG: SH3 domain-containing protein [Defluviitaleaceae bacterium]|nr:SH3 domain-containing protein [Defluviitaleaceae bacterium]
MHIKAFLTGLLFCIIILPVAAYGAEANEYEEYGYEEVQTTFVTTARLNLRPSPNTDDEQITTINAGSIVEVIDFRDGIWFAVDYNGTLGYMYAEFLREWEAVEEPAASANVEMLEWSVVRNILPKNTPIDAIDVRTGRSFQLVSFSHGNHADVIPATREDTDTLRQVFGGWTWTPRPIVIFVGDRAIAASINGMPHGGTPNSSNGMNGHICMHFVGSRTHNGNRSHERDHQNAIREAYNTASNW